MQWRLFDLGAIDAASNLAATDVFYESVRDGKSLPILGVGRIKPSAVTIGRFQSVEMEVNVDRCKQLGVDIIRRSSGGGAVFHGYDNEVVYAVIGPENLFPKDYLEGYKLVCGWIINALAKHNIIGTFVPLNDIVVGGKKISGNAQVRNEGVFVQYGTVLYKPDLEQMFELLKVSKEKLSDKGISDPKQRVIGVKDLANISIDELSKSVLDTFSEGKECIKGELSKEEATRIEHLANATYRSSEWNFRR